jgi:osmotically-inducible protein OsmY
MNSPLQNVYLTAAANKETAALLATDQEAVEHVEEAESHVHLPNPSFWPIVLSAALLICLGGFLFISTFPWISIIAIPFVLVSILGWALEDPMAPPREETRPTREVTSYEEAAVTGRPTALGEAVLRQAQEVADRTVTVSSTEWSAHKVNVEIEREGVVLALYGKVELDAQRKELEESLLKLPGVIDVKNFLVAEDSILNAVNARIERLKAAGKLEGAKDIHALVENYIVNLYGEVPTNEMKYRLERELITIPGVRVVVNRVNLKDISGDLGKTRNRVGPG